MTLRELFQYALYNPKWLIYYFVGLAIVSLLLYLFGRDSNQAYKIRWVFSVVCFLSVIPGLFAISLNVYLFLFERQSIWDMNLVTQVLPIACMFISLYLIRITISFDYIPGFEKLTSITGIIFGIMAIMWVIDRTQIFAFSMIPFSYILIGFIALILFIRFGITRFR